MWMLMVGGTSPKRTILVSNSSQVQQLNTGHLVKSKYASKSQVQTTIRYKDASGKTRFKGSPSLKGTQTLVVSNLSKGFVLAGIFFLGVGCHGTLPHSKEFPTILHTMKTRSYCAGFARRLLLAAIDMVQDEAPKFDLPVPSPKNNEDLNLGFDGLFKTLSKTYDVLKSSPLAGVFFNLFGPRNGWKKTPVKVAPGDHFTTLVLQTVGVQVSEEPLHLLFGAVPATTWSTAELGKTVQYLRGCRSLGLPAEFRPFLPKNIGEGFDPVAGKYTDELWTLQTMKGWWSLLYNILTLWRVSPKTPEKNIILKRRFYPAKRRFYPTKRRFYPTGHFGIKIMVFKITAKKKLD